MYKVCLLPGTTQWRQFLKFPAETSGETTSKLRRTGFLDPSTFSKAQKSRVLAMANIRQPVNEFFSGKKPSKMSTQFKTWLQTCLRWRSMINDMASTREQHAFRLVRPTTTHVAGMTDKPHANTDTLVSCLFCFTLFNDPDTPCMEYLPTCALKITQM